MDRMSFQQDDCLEIWSARIAPRSRIIYLVIIMIVVAGIAVLPFIYVDVSVQARGYFQSEIEKQMVHTPYQGMISYISVHNGDHVIKGDTLFIIDHETIKTRQLAILRKIAENNAAIADLTSLTSLDTSGSVYENLVTSRYRAEYANLKNQHNLQYQKYQKKKSEHERALLLHDQKIIPDTDFENSIFSLNSEKENLSQILLYQESVWQSDLMMRRNDSVTLVAELEQCQEEYRNRIIIAPLSGEIIQSADIQPGTIVFAGQKIAEISPVGELVATCYVSPDDIGLIHENQKVRIQVDALKYTEWGMIEGEISDISDDMIISEGSAACFRIKCRLHSTFLSLKNGTKANIRKGMSHNTRIIVIRRSIFNLLFDKADKWFNPYTAKAV